MRARIYQQPKTATQSGQANTHDWILEYGQNEQRTQDPLMGWFGSGDTRSQLTLRFPTRDDAIAYAERENIPFDLELPTARIRPPKAYADNFRFDRRANWTH
ncbi:ETC complex I subunit [Acetobacteraceae bacterium KSS8]|uniref:ETC complex I subunit n=1 Tax=Endosaccharibacter trunci TaxID=2812733 RepID=A0ABT1W7L9_9PROT|nr:ETC complex I subunit [Acetobacteraceae bacterium KSS8]